MKYDPRDELSSDQLDPLARAFSDQLSACLEECVHGRRGLFSDRVSEETDWPEATRLRELAIALQNLLAQDGERSALVDEFLDLCTIHGETDPGERKLARALLDRIENGQVGSPAVEEKKPW